MNKKVLFLLTLTLCIAIPSLCCAFTDTQGHWAEASIHQYSNQGIIHGYQDDTFQPDAYMTRAELMTVIDKLIGLNSETDKYIPDVKSSDWFYQGIKNGIYFGILQGDEEGRIHPNNNVTREEAILIITRALQLPIDEGNFEIDFTDSQTISQWARKEVVSFTRKNYIQGYEDNTLRPKASITRAEMLTILNRVIKNIPDSLSGRKVTGLTLIRDKNVSLNNAEIYGNLIVGEGSAKSILLNNTIINGNLILYAPIDMTKVAVTGKVIKVYENSAVSNLHYINDEFGIRFSIPDGATAISGSIADKANLSYQDFILVDIQKNDEFYLKSVTELSKEMIKSMNYDSIFRLKEQGKIHGNFYELYADNAASHLLVIKRDDIVYAMLFYNVVSDNLVDSVISNIAFTTGEKVANHENVIYKNGKLSLKFTYKNGYVGVDDSYNTGIIFSGDAMFKLFIQVNMITDIDNYSVEEVQYLLKNLAKSDGSIIKEELKKINNHDAIQFEIEAGDGKIISLYVIIGKNLYNFIFKGDSVAIDAIGKEMFTNMVNSMEF